MNFLGQWAQRAAGVYHGVRKDAALTWFTLAVASFIFLVFSVVGIASGQVQEALADYITTPINSKTPWAQEAVLVWAKFRWLRASLTFFAIFTFASTLRYWTARLLGSDIDDYQKLKSLDLWRRDFILIVFLLPWIGAASFFFVAHMAAVNRYVGAAHTLGQFIAAARGAPGPYLALTPFAALSVTALLSPGLVHIIWTLLDPLRQVISKSNVLRVVLDAPLVIMFVGLAALFAWGGDHAVNIARLMGPVVIVSLSFAFLTALGGWLIDWGRRFKTPLFLIFVSVPFIIHALGRDDNHALRILAPRAPQPYSIVEALKAYYRTPEEQKLPLILVSAEGGGIRAAYFTANVLARLEDQCPQLARRVFAISAVSGGAVGAAAYVAALSSGAQTLKSDACYVAPAPAPDFYQSRLHSVFANDHLSPGLARQAFTEVLQRWYPEPLAFTDRQVGLEKSFEQAFRAQFNQSGAFEASAFAHQEGAPFLLLNTTRVDDGSLYVASPLDLSVNQGPAEIFDFRNSLWPQASPDFRLSTMALNSARFPIISPAGSVSTADGPVRFVDGGYFDNSGAESIVSLDKRIREAAASLGIRPRIVLVHIAPNPASAAPVDENAFKLNLDVAELNAVLATREARVQLSLVRMSELVPDCEYKRIDMTYDEHVPFRLGWVMSASAADALRRQVDAVVTPSALSTTSCKDVESSMEQHAPRRIGRPGRDPSETPTPAMAP